jgi:hypothetical protein
MTGRAILDQDGGWMHQVFLATPGIPGDSGGAVIDAQGRALGILSDIVLAPLTGTTLVSDISRELQYMHDKNPSTLASVALVNGTEGFVPLV